ncbi:MAG: DUF1292 domain-containing protein [Lachnospiraceae bacterium]
MSKNKETQFTEDTISLILDGNKEVECDILAIFPIKEQFYVALMPQTPVDGYEEGEYFLYRYQSDGENVELSDIESDAEWEAAEDKFEELLDEEEFNNLSE